MTMSRIDPTLNVTARTATPRQTPVPGGRRFRDALDAGAVQLARGALALSGAAPVGQAVTAVTVGGANPSGGQTPGPGFGSGGLEGSGGTSGTSTATMELLEMQRRIGAEQVHFSTVSNVLKARHDTAKSVVGNIR